MKKSILFFLIISLAGCATVRESLVNPLNWFDRNDATATASPEDLKPLVPASKVVQIADNRSQIARVTSLDVAPAQGGFLVSATGSPSQAGGFNAELVPVSADGGVLTMDFRIDFPADAVAGHAALVPVAQFISSSDFSGISRVRVQGQANSLTKKRH